MRYLIVINSSTTEHFWVDARDGEEAKRKGAEMAYQKWGQVIGRVDAYRQDGPPLRYTVTVHITPTADLPPVAPDVFEDAFDMIGTREVVREAEA